jgi:DNA mismatch repair protein MutS2
MDEKSLDTLEFDKILDRLADYCSFNASAELAHALRPTAIVEEALRRQAETTEARIMLTTRPETTIGGARDVRSQAEAASRNTLLLTSDLLDIKATLISARTLVRTFERHKDTFPHLSETAEQFPPPLGIVDAISQAISERGEILDTASEKLASIRTELRISHDRLLTRLQRMVNNPEISQFLQENLVTQRDGRYVLPLRADFKGRIKAIVHDQSSSGATLFVEPLGVVDLNNRFRELQLEARDEERRILTELSRRVGDHAFYIIQAVETLAALDLAFSKAKYAEDLNAVAPALHEMRRSTNKESKHPGSTVRLWQARHPLLDPEAVVPIDLELDPNTFALVITGPNTGGKTVSLKTVGLLALMAQSGLHIPAKEHSALSVFEAIYADIGDEQSIEQSLSTFSGHITTIIQILRTADSRSLVLLDELGAGTDPQEGAALAQAILTNLLARRVTTLVATHYPELKTYAHATPGVVNASVEFDLESLRPTYHLTIGLPGRSNALSIAQRLGLPEEIVTAARAGIDPDDLRSEDLLDEIHRQRDLTREARARADEDRNAAETVRTELADRLEKIEDERRDVLEDARAEAQGQLDELQAELREVRRALARARQPLEVLKSIEEDVEDLEEEIEMPVERGTAPALATHLIGASSPEHRALRLGDRVRLRTLNTQGVVDTLGEEQAEIQVGSFRIRAQLTDLELVSGSQDITDLPKTTVSRSKDTQEDSPRDSGLSLPPSPHVELDLRGRRVDEALETLEGYLDSAFLASMPFVRVIHGKGTGRLREAVRQALRNHPNVASFETGHPGEGGDGVTVAKIR